MFATASTAMLICTSLRKDGWKGRWLLCERPAAQYCFGAHEWVCHPQHPLPIKKVYVHGTGTKLGPKEPGMPGIPDTEEEEEWHEGETATRGGQEEGTPQEDMPEDLQQQKSLPEGQALSKDPGSPPSSRKHNALSS